MEEVKFPKNVDMIVGQECLMKILLYEDPYYSSSQSVSFMGIPVIDEHGPMYYHTETTFSDWHSNNSEIIEVRGDTLVALVQGECEMTAVYQDRFGEHSVSCYVTVSDLDIPTAEDTVFVQYGDDIELCKFNIPGSYPISYVLEKGDGTADYATLATEELPYETSSLIQFSPVYTYSLRKIVPEQGFTSLRLICEPLGMDVTMPIVTLPSNEGENRNTNL